MSDVMDEKLPNKSKIMIQVNTKFKPQMYKEKGWEAEDITEDVEKTFHQCIKEYVEKQLIDNDDFESEILEMMADKEELIKGTDEFMKLGEISIQLWQEEELDKIAKTQTQVEQARTLNKSLTDFSTEKSQIQPEVELR